LVQAAMFRTFLWTSLVRIPSGKSDVLIKAFRALPHYLPVDNGAVTQLPSKYSPHSWVTVSTIRGTV